MPSRSELYERQRNLQRHYQAVYKELMKIPGVRGVGIGLKRVREKLTDQICYRVYVEKKVSRDNLPQSQIIPQYIHSIETDVLESIKNIAPLGDNKCPEGPDEEKKGILRGGIQISNGKKVVRRKFGKVISIQAFPGTLGCFVTLNGHGGSCILTNHHVLYAGNSSVGDELKIGQPKPKESICCDSDVIGRTFSSKGIQEIQQEFENNEWQPGFKNVRLDCAIGKLKTDRTIKFEVEDIGPIAGVANRVDPDDPLSFSRVLPGERVIKRGRTTCITEGIVEEVNYNDTSGPNDEIIIDDQILITPIDRETKDPIQPNNGIYDPPFVDYGDSGSILLNQNHEIVGLVWAVARELLPDPSDPNIEIKQANGQGLANHIELVTEALNITINTPAPNPGETFANTETTVSLSQTQPKEIVTSSQLFRRIESELMQSTAGRYVLDLIRQFEDEVIDLINYNRPIMVTWRRNQGPAFVAAFINHGLGKIKKIPKELGGISLQTLMRNMSVKLEENGSAELSEVIRRHSLSVFNYIEKLETLEQILNEFTQSEINSDFIIQ